MTPDPYAALDAEETRLLTQLAEVRSAKATLRRVLGLADPPHGPAVAAEEEPAATATPPEKPPGKPEPRPARAAAAGVVGREERALQVARLLAGAGPLKAEPIAERLGCHPFTVKWAIDLHPEWFRKLGGNRLNPWELTEAGRAVATAAAA